jgi:hypothetical protein
MNRVLQLCLLFNLLIHRIIESSFKSLNHCTLERIQKYNQILSSSQQNVLSIWTEFHTLYFLCLILNSEGLKRFIFVILSIEKMDHLIQRHIVSGCLYSWLRIWSNKKTCHKFTHIIKTCSFTLIYLNQALLFLIFPNSSSSVLRATKKWRILRIQIYLSNCVSVTNKAAKYIIVVQWPIHYAIMRVPFTCTKNTLIVMSKLYEVNSIVLIVICVYFPKICY